MEQSMIRFENVSISYDKHIAVNGFSDEIKKGEFVALIGPNGSGKSTLINAVMGTIPLKEGNIYIKGKNNIKYTSKERARIVAVVPQRFSTSFAFTVRDIVSFGRNPYLKRMKNETVEDLDIVNEAMRMTGVLHLANRRITELSGGECQRVVIAEALAQKPELIILDEPTNHLDIHHNLDIMEILKNLNEEEGITVLAVLHDINNAARYAKRIVVMNEANRIASGSAEDIIKEEILKPIYKIDLVVRYNRLISSPEITPIRKNTNDTIETNGLKVHVVCGGGSGQYLLQELRSLGYTVSCGVLCVGDSDCEVALSLGIPTVIDAPYSSISKRAYNDNMKYINEADAIILTDVSVGEGNLDNLRAILTVNDVPVIIIRNENRDYVKGKADEIMNEISAKKNTVFTDVKETSHILNKMLATK